MKLCQLPACLFAAAWMIGTAFAQIAEEYRLWTNTAGKEIEATLVSVDAAARSVKIKMKDGKVYDVPIASLSPADLEYAKTRYAAMQAAAPVPAESPGKRPPVTVLPAAKFKAPSATDYLNGIAKVRPRLIQNAAGWAAIQKQIASTPALTKLMATLKASGEDLLKDPELNRINGEGIGDVSEGSRAIYRMALLAALHFGDGDLKWKERAVREVILLCDKTNFRDWHPAEAAPVADMVIAVTLGYDWFRDGFNAKQAAEIRTFLRQKGVEALIAHIQGGPVPPTAFGTAPESPADEPPATKDTSPVSLEQMRMASALLLNAMGFADEEPAMAKAAANAAAKVFGEGMLRFAPSGVWPEGLMAGDAVMDYAAMVIQSLRSAAGKDYGLSLLEGVPQFGLARLHLFGPTGQPFHLHATSAGGDLRPWITTWLASVHGNPGLPAFTSSERLPVDTAHFSEVGHYLYFNRQAARDGVAESLDYVTAGGMAATVRSDWSGEALYLAAKGGDNREPQAQLDIGTFVLDAGGVRWGVELGMENGIGEAPADEDRTKRFQHFLEGTRGQNTLSFGGANQELNARASVIASHSGPETGFAIIDMTKAYDKHADKVHRGIRAVRGASPYLVIQDDMSIKSTQPLVWSMQTQSIDIAVDGSTATLKQGDRQLLATIVSPKGATFTAEEPPPPADPENGRKLGTATPDYEGENIKTLKATVPATKGNVSLCITFTLQPTAPAHTHTPASEWMRKK